jgi:hypothetical protein
MDIIKTTKAYDAWLRETIPLIDAELRLKPWLTARSRIPLCVAADVRRLKSSGIIAVISASSRRLLLFERAAKATLDDRKAQAKS